MGFLRRGRGDEEGLGTQEKWGYGLRRVWNRCNSLRRRSFENISMVNTLTGIDSPIGGGQLEADTGSFTDCSGQARVTF